MIADGAATGRALVVHPVRKAPPGEAGGGSANGRSAEAWLDEAIGLARTIRLDVVRAEIARLAAPRPSSLFGSGTVDALAGLISENAIGLVIVNAALFRCSSAIWNGAGRPR